MGTRGLLRRPGAFRCRGDGRFRRKGASRDAFFRGGGRAADQSERRSHPPATPQPIRERGRGFLRSPRLFLYIPHRFPFSFFPSFLSSSLFSFFPFLFLFPFFPSFFLPFPTLPSIPSRPRTLFSHPSLLCSRSIISLHPPPDLPPPPLQPLPDVPPFHPPPPTPRPTQSSALRVGRVAMATARALALTAQARTPPRGDSACAAPSP